MGKIIAFTANDISLFQFMSMFVQKDEEGKLVCSGKRSRNVIASVPIEFMVEYSHAVFQLLGNSWGNWNACPDWRKMQQISKKWEDTYNMELVGISFDTLEYRINKTLSGVELAELLREVEEIAPNSFDLFEGDTSDVARHRLATQVIKEKKLTLWWD